MKQIKLTFFLTLLMSMMGLQAFADWDTSTKVNVGTLYYYLDTSNNQAEVTKMPSGYYTGDIEIPSSFMYNSTNYVVTSIGSRAFSLCSDLTSITIPNNVTNIGKYAFNGCSGLESITIPNSMTSIGDGAFSGCSGLESITIPNSVTSIGEGIFGYCSGLTSIEVVSGNAKYDSRDYCNAIIETASNTLFAGCKNTVIPNSVTSIGDKAFSGNSGLTSITIPNSVTSIGQDAFANCSGLTSVIVPSNVTSIGNGAFYGCSLTSVIVPSNVTSIGNNAFSGCSGLTSVTINSNSILSDHNTSVKDFFGDQVEEYIIGNNVTAIGNEKFGHCYHLTSITIPNNVTTIGFGAFESCSSLTSITIGNSVTSIGQNAFEYCSGLTKVIVSDIAAWCGISGIGSSYNTYNPLLYYAHHLYSDENTEITDLVIPDGVTSIGQYAFDHCSGLESVTIPNSVTSIGQNAFSGCSGLESVTIPNSVTSIGNSAFNCSSLTSVAVDINTPLTIDWGTFPNRTNATLYVPAGCKSAYEAADYWKEFKEIVEMADPNIVFADENVKAICVAHWDTDHDGELSYDEAAAVTTISDYFQNNTSITSFDEFAYFTGVTSIGFLAFDGCSQLASITLPEGLTDINGYAFRGCALTSMSIPSTVTFIENNFLANCKDIAQITVDNGNTTFDSRNNCNAIIVTNDVNDPYNTSNLLYFSNTLLTGCKNTSIPNTVTSIGHEAFYGCSGLTSINIPCSVTRIEGGAFYGCTGLTSITIPSSVTDIYNNKNLFGKCDALTSIIVENGNATYDSRDGCNAIIETSTKTLVSACNNSVIPNGITSIGMCAFEDCTEMTSITIPNSVTGIGFGAFRGSGLTSITIPNSVTGINNYAFQMCYSLSSVTIPNSVTSILEGAFKDCSSLTSVTVDINAPLTIEDETFSNRANATLYVPAGCKSAYEAADYWSDFGTIEEMDPESVTIAMKTGGGVARSMIAYSSKYALDFTSRPELKAYIACGYNDKKEVLLVHVKVVPPYTGMVIKTSNGIYDGGEYDVPTTTEEYYYANLLVPVVETGTVTPTETIADVEYTNLTIGTLVGGGIGFVRLTSNWTTHNKSYLRIPTALYNSLASARGFGDIGVEFVEGEEATGILNAKRNALENNGNYYDLLGRKVKPIGKGLYIHNGKKVLVK